MAKTLFITGASSGLGRATALLFSERGWNVIATMRKPETDKALGTVANIKLLRLDVSKLDQIESSVHAALELGPVDAVFNNAGYDLAGPVEGMTDAQLVQQIDTNLLGAIRVTKAFTPAFRERKAGVFVATTSIGGHVTFPLNAPYHATKWGLEGFYESLSFELAGFGIRVKTVAPGGMKTDFAGRSMVLAQHPAYASIISSVLAVFSDPSRAARYATTEQIAAVVYEAVTDGKDQVHYIAGEDAKATYAQRLQVGAEVFRQSIQRMFIK